VIDWCETEFENADEGVVVSVQLAAGWFVEGLLRRFGRCALCIIDYGAPAADLANRDVDQVVRTYRDHTTGHDWLAIPGATDVTVDVNVTAIERIARRLGARVNRLTQADFLVGLGIAERINDAIESERRHAVDGDVMSQLTARSDRISMEALVDPDGLGGFEVLTIESGT
jgi:SAM-dependent MidA family methyltransferase